MRAAQRRGYRRTPFRSRPLRLRLLVNLSHLQLVTPGTTLAACCHSKRRCIALVRERWSKCHTVRSFAPVIASANPVAVGFSCHPVSMAQLSMQCAHHLAAHGITIKWWYCARSGDCGASEWFESRRCRQRPGPCHLKGVVKVVILQCWSGFSRDRRGFSLTQAGPCRAETSSAR